MNSRLASKWSDDFNTLVESLMLSSNLNHSIPISVAGLEETLLKKVSLLMYVLFHENHIWGLSNCILIREYGVIKQFFFVNFPNFLSNWFVLKIWCSTLDNNACYLCLEIVGVVKGPIHVFHMITTKFDKQCVIDVVRGVRMEDTRPHFLKALKFLRKIL